MRQAILAVVFEVSGLLVLFQICMGKARWFECVSVPSCKRAAQVCNQAAAQSGGHERWLLHTLRASAGGTPWLVSGSGMRLCFGTEIHGCID